MNPSIVRIGPLEIHAFTAWMAIGIVIGFGIILATASARQERITPWFDCALGALVGGVIGARLGHVWLNWAYFSAHTDQIADLSNGGLDWHGAIALGLVFAFGVALVRHVPFWQLSDALALALPIGAIFVWIACASAPSAYGLEVPTLADFPSWLVTESPDIYSNVAPRLNLLPPGIVLAALVLLIVLVLMVLQRLSRLRLWLVIALYAVGLGVIDLFRADYAPIWLGHRADQILDLGVAMVAILIFGLSGLRLLLRNRSHVVQMAAEGMSK
ncbi:MAG TPA: prolipoprotein diacylglyceryl transferase family protein [Aggregatilineales bacterium]|nr:prolipoprotein diacylglyceryl transferase family protein [Aggregatilineales bacterium]